MTIILWFLWFVIVGITIFQYKDSLAQTKGWSKFIALITLIIGSPFVAVGTLVSDILDIVFPEGWDAGDGDNIGF